MRNISSVFSLFALAFLFSCSSESVKSSENYIEMFSVEGISPIEINIRSDLSLIYIWTESSEYNSLISKTPNIRISAGASFSNNKSDLSKWAESGFEYTVTAENSESRTYSVQIDTTIPRKYSFETWEKSTGSLIYDIPSDLRWASGNAGIGLALGILGIDNKNPENYPTKKTTEGYIGNAVLMETKEGGSVFGREVPLFSGNFFLGSFNASKAITDELAATELGRIYPAKPKIIKGYYKYTEGPNSFFYGNLNDGTNNPNRNDSCNMSVQFYQSDSPSGEDTTLTVKDIDDSPLVIAEVRLADCSDTGGEFKPFEENLVYSSEPDFENHRYKLAITFAASRNGDLYAGKIGSKFIVDEIEIVDY